MRYSSFFSPGYPNLAPSNEVLEVFIIAIGCFMGTEVGALYSSFFTSAVLATSVLTTGVIIFLGAESTFTTDFFLPQHWLLVVPFFLKY